MAKRRKKKKISVRAQLYLVLGLMMAILFLPTTILLIIGMAPTLAAALIDNTKRKAKVLTVGAMNLAGCSPFLFELWINGHNFETSLRTALDSKAIIVMYSAAGVGYLIDWALVGLISSFMYQRGLKRAKTIKKEQKELIERWGKKVTGEVVLDEEGFPVEDELASQKKE